MFLQMADKRRNQNLCLQIIGKAFLRLVQLDHFLFWHLCFEALHCKVILWNSLKLDRYDAYYKYKYTFASFQTENQVVVFHSELFVM